MSFLKAVSDVVAGIAIPPGFIPAISSSYDTASIPEEYDDHKRDVELSLYTRIVEASKNSSNNSGHNDLSHHPTFGVPTVMDFNEFTHWMLVFEFDDGLVRIIEGLNEDDTLIPSYRKNREEGGVFTMRLGSLKMSPKEVRELVITNPYNGRRYELMNCNCQHWVNAALKALNIKPISSTLDNEMRWKVVAAGATVAFPPVGLAVLGIRQALKLKEFTDRMK